MEKMNEVEGKLLATSKELDEYKALAKYNDKRFKDYQNEHFPKCQCSTRIKELEVTLGEKDYELHECKKTVNKIEEIAKQNQIRINDCESKLALQEVQMEILCNKVPVIEEELRLYDWRIDWNELNEHDGKLESAPFHTTSDLYCLSLSVDYDHFEDHMMIYLHRCRDYYKKDKKEGWIQTLEGFNYKIYVVCDDEIRFTNSGHFADYSLFNIGRAYQRSRGFLCYELGSGEVMYLGRDFHIICRAF